MRLAVFALFSTVVASVGCLASEPAAPPAYPQTHTTVVIFAPAAQPASAPLQVAMTPFGSTAPTHNALRGDIFLLPEHTERLPDFRALRPVGAVYATEINIPARRWDQGFPGVSDRVEWFGLRYDGAFQVSTPGTYHFRVVSDDGARLFIDDQPVVDNDGTHPPSSAEGATTLAPGPHHLVLEYFQGPRFDIALQLFWTPPAQTESLFRVTPWSSARESPRA